ncbi:DUF4907 domain-containing protein [Maribellus maritimus]|uniref:DUF4907 domain-containing protein n=1 Tax=Maribellus maritimus TaxID=2870838 RepID=UPI001EEBA329|nr:DUF4907 domain-containing protein [Maribellus maritimus]MCG6186869.1 DUF4907 domain-containing protein [Maribellus maritimus]
MIKKTAYILISILTALVVLFALKEKKTETAKLDQERFSIQTFTTDNGGWGYSIFDNKKRIIKQDVIPVIRKNMSFQSEKDARVTGLLVIRKLNAKKLPTLNRQELENLHISLGSYDIN